MAIAPKTLKILFLAANPAGSSHLRLDQESRAIDRSLRSAKHRDRFELLQHWAVSVSDLQELLLRHGPDIVHFSGHGSASGDIILEEPTRSGNTSRELELGSARERGQPGHVSPRALSETFLLLKDNIRCVVLNACYSENQARAIAEHIDCVVGMTKAIGDEAAIRFATSFYQALGYGRNVATAFGLGRNEIDLSGLEEQDTPQLLALRTDPKGLFLLGNGETTAPPPTPAVPVEIPSPRTSTEPLSVFFSYSHKDETLRDELAKHLSVLLRQGIIDAWHDRRIGAGAEWAGEIDKHLNSADIILLLVSANFLASDYCYDKEMMRAMQRHEDKSDPARVVPVILRPVEWRGAPFGKLQALPKDGKPIVGPDWHSHDEAFADVAKGIRRLAEELKKKRPPDHPR